MPDIDTLHLIAQVIAWMEGEPLDEIAEAALQSDYQDAAQQCSEDLGLA